MARFDLSTWRDDIQALQQQLAAYMPGTVSSVKSAQHEKYASRAPSPTTVEEVFDPLTKALGGRSTSTTGRGGSASGSGNSKADSGSAAQPSAVQDKGQSQPPPASRPEDVEIGEGAFNPKTTSQPAEIAIGEGAFNPAPASPPARPDKPSQPSRPFSQFLSALPRGVGRAAEEAAKALATAVGPLAPKVQELMGHLPPAEEVLKNLLAQADANAFVQPAPSLTPDEEFDKYFLNPSPDSEAGKDLAAMMDAQMFGRYGMAPDTPTGPAAPIPPHPDDIFGDPSAAVAASASTSGPGLSASATPPAASAPSAPSGPTSAGPIAGATAPTPALPSTPGTQVVMAHDGTPYEIHTVPAGDYKTAYENLASLGVSGADAARVFATAQQASKPVEVTDKLGLSGTGTRVIVSRGNIHVLNDVSDKPEDYWSSANLGTIPRNIRGLLGYGGAGPAFQFGSQLAGTPLPPWAMGMFNPYFNFMMGPMGMHPMGMGMFMDPMMMYMLMMGMSGMFNPPATPQPPPGSPFG